MLRSTLPLLRCPKREKKGFCHGELKLLTEEKSKDVLYGDLQCEKCRSIYPILEGVAILVDDVRTYLLMHVKGISKNVPDAKIPKKYRNEYLEYKAEIQEEHIEEDLESDRVNALYLMNHYLDAKQMVRKSEDPLIRDLIQKHWDQNPFSHVKEWITGDSTVVELGCGVGGLYRSIAKKVKLYLGVDSSFQSILIARHLNLGAPFKGELKTPKDLLQGNLSEKFSYSRPEANPANVDFIVGDIDATPLLPEYFDISVSLNAIDMLEDPKALPEHMKWTLKVGGIAIQSGPYIWHERIARKLRSILPKDISESGRAVEWLFDKLGLIIRDRKDHLPWLFFKHGRQLELYSVHLLKAQKSRK